MTKIQLYRRHGLPCGLKVAGHSGYAQSGSDIVCAAVSVLVQTLEIGLTDVLGLAPSVRVDADGALIELRWAACDRKELNVLVESVGKMCFALAQSYSDYVKYAEVSL